MMVCALTLLAKSERRSSRKATDQYFREHAIHPLLHRIDYSARLLVKPV
jgi:hypothetical protein